MGRLRDHYPRFTSMCPDSSGCARLYHGTLAAGDQGVSACECCGGLLGDDLRIPTRREWFSQSPQTAGDAAALFAIDAARAPAGHALIGWTWEYADGSYGLVRIEERIAGRPMPTMMRPVFVRLAVEPTE